MIISGFIVVQKSWKKADQKPSGPELLSHRICLSAFRISNSENGDVRGEISIRLG
jgi:hypothetical protein